MSEVNPFSVNPIVESRPLRLKISTGRIFLAWLCFFLVATIGGGIVGLILGAIMGGVMGAAGMPMENIVLAAQILGFAGSLPVSFLCYWWSVNQFILKSMQPSNIPQPPAPFPR